MKKILCLGLVALLFCISAKAVKAIQVNTAAAVVADSANTPETAVYRDTSGNFQAGTVTLQELTVTNDVSIQDGLSVTGSVVTGLLNVSTNVITSMTMHIEAETKSSTAAVITAFSGQTADLLRVRDSSLNPLVRITPNGRMALWSRTRAQIDALTPDVIGEMVYCSDCSVKNVCISTGTAVSQWMRMDLATAGCGTGN